MWWSWSYRLLKWTDGIYSIEQTMQPINTKKWVIYIWMIRISFAYSLIPSRYRVMWYSFNNCLSFFFVIWIWRRFLLNWNAQKESYNKEYGRQCFGNFLIQQRKCRKLLINGSRRGSNSSFTFHVSLDCSWICAIIQWKTILRWNRNIILWNIVGNIFTLIRFIEILFSFLLLLLERVRRDRCRCSDRSVAP